jgi:hypothetical protein
MHALLLSPGVQPPRVISSYLGAGLNFEERHKRPKQMGCHTTDSSEYSYKSTYLSSVPLLSLIHSSMSRVLLRAIFRTSHIHQRIPIAGGPIADVPRQSCRNFQVISPMFRRYLIHYTTYRLFDQLAIGNSRLLWDLGSTTVPTARIMHFMIS